LSPPVGVRCTLVAARKCQACSQFQSA
jgi:hypothetical protein